MSQPIVDANYRFIAASQEVNARIAQRQQALALYVTLVVSLLAALVALRGPLGGSAGAGGATAAPVEWLVLGFPVAAWCLALLNHKAEQAISNLRVFLSELERLGGADQRLPSYNTDPRWSQQANRARRWHDWAAALLAAGGSTIGLGAALAIYPQRLAEARGFMVVAVLLAIGALAVLLATPRWRYAPADPMIA